jgi:positive regulator of sigma E activity
MKITLYKFLHCAGITAIVYLVFLIIVQPTDNYLFIFERWFVTSLFITVTACFIEYLQETRKRKKDANT